MNKENGKLIAKSTDPALSRQMMKYNFKQWSENVNLALTAANDLKVALKEDYEEVKYLLVALYSRVSEFALLSRYR